METYEVESGDLKQEIVATDANEAADVFVKGTSEGTTLGVLIMITEYGGSPHFISAEAVCKRLGLFGGGES